MKIAPAVRGSKTANMIWKLMLRQRIDLIFNFLIVRGDLTSIQW